LNVWTTPATASGPIDNVLVWFPGGRRGFRLFHRQPTAEPLDAGTAADGRQRWRFTGPFSGVTLCATDAPASIDLPGGYAIALVTGAMPAEALLALGYDH
jgi:hypothetical protein